MCRALLGASAGSVWGLGMGEKSLVELGGGKRRGGFRDICVVPLCLSRLILVRH